MTQTSITELFEAIGFGVFPLPFGGWFATKTTIALHSDFGIFHFDRFELFFCPNGTLTVRKPLNQWKEILVTSLVMGTQILGRH